MSVATTRSKSTTSVVAAASDVDQWQRLHRDFGWDISCHADEKDGVWHTGSTETIHFPDDSHDDLFQVEDDSFWFRHRNQVVERTLESIGMPDILWEVGAGNGCVAAYLQRRGVAVAAIEPIAAGARNSRRRGIDAVICGRFEELKLPTGSLPAIGCFDVLEHIEKPEVLVREFARVLEPGGLLVATVPALNWLWSKADTISGHFRRYSRRSFRQLGASEGFQVEAADYFMMSLVAPMFCMRTLPTLLSRRGCEKESLQRQMKDTGNRRTRSPIEFLLRSESALARIVPLPLGTSVIGVFRKPLENSAGTKVMN